MANAGTNNDDPWFDDWFSQLTQKHEKASTFNNANNNAGATNANNTDPNNNTTNTTSNNNDNWDPFGETEAVPWWMSFDEANFGDNNDPFSDASNPFDDNNTANNANNNNNNNTDIELVVQGSGDTTGTGTEESPKKKKKKKKKEPTEEDGDSGGDEDEEEEDSNDANDMNKDTIDASNNGPMIDTQATPIQAMNTVELESPSAGNKVGSMKRNIQLIRDLHVVLRKYNLFHAIFLFLTLMLFSFGLYSGFYEFKGNFSNIFVLIGLVGGLVLGAVSDNMLYTDNKDRWFAPRNVQQSLEKVGTILRIFCIYFIITMFVITALFIVALVYSCLFPSNYTQYCKDEEDNGDGCDIEATTFTLVFGTLSAFTMSFIWFFLCMFYMDILSRILINLSQLYPETRQLSGLRKQAVIWAFDFRYHWRNFKKRSTRCCDDCNCYCDSDPHTDMLCMHTCIECCRLCILCCACGGPGGGRGGPRGGPGPRPGGRMGGGGHGGGGCHCGDCNCFSGCKACDLRCGDCRDCDCGKCDLDCGGCGGCDCDLGSLKGGGEGVIGCIFVVVVFLLPIVILACLALPFWFLAQWIVSKLSHDAPFWVTVVVFIVVFVIPPCMIWYALFTLLCGFADDSTGWTVFCYLWSIIELVLSV